MNTITLSRYQLATNRNYREQLLGKRATYTTPGGTKVTGTITNHPMDSSKLLFAITQDDGRWAGIHADDTITIHA
jgi:hypothetical protein